MSTVSGEMWIWLVRNLLGDSPRRQCRLTADSPENDFGTGAALVHTSPLKLYTERVDNGRAQGAPCIHTLARTRVHTFKYKLWICTTYTHADPHIKRKTVYAMEDTASTHYKTNCGSGARTQGAYNMTEVVGLSYTWCVLHRWVGNGRGWTQCPKCTRTRRKAGEAPAVHQVTGSPWVRPRCR